MQTTANELLKNKTPAQLRREAWAGKSNISPDQEKMTKDIGHGILVPNAFQVPNEIVDDGYLETLKGAELRVLIFLIRKTFGFNKIGGDRVPISQIMKATGLKHTTVVEATQALEKDGLIKIHREVNEDGTKKTNFYQLITRLDYNRKKI